MGLLLRGLPPARAETNDGPFSVGGLRRKDDIVFLLWHAYVDIQIDVDVHVRDENVVLRGAATAVRRVKSIPVFL